MPTNLGSTLAKYRRYKGITQEDLAKIVGVTRGAIAQIELGQIAWPRLDTLQSITTALCVPLETVLREAGIIGVTEGTEPGQENGHYFRSLINACPDMLALFLLVREHTASLPEILRVVRAVIGTFPPPVLEEAEAEESEAKE